ncbi:MAG: hypothetical protein JNL98_35545 [Bryobacterales bacterium]|nr:hypothetical protein [Bryobacterales bacterium]
MFLSQEAFFGHGINILAKHFDFFLCKDEYVQYFVDAPLCAPLYSVGDVRVIAGSNHLLNELARRLAGTHEVLPKLRLPKHQEERVAQTQRANLVSREDLCPARRGTFEDVEWYWYHMGDGCHFAAMGVPSDGGKFFLDPAWLRVMEEHLKGLQEAGFRLVSVGDYVDAIRDAHPQSLPALVEGAWNCRQHSGVLCWMGQHQLPWENSTDVLALVSKSRQRLRQVELSLGEKTPDVQAALDDAWMCQLYAECSGALGPLPIPTSSGIQTVVEAANETVNRAQRLIGDYQLDVTLTHPSLYEAACTTIADAPWLTADVVGPGRLVGIRESDDLSYQMIDLEWVVDNDHTTSIGVRLPFLCDEIVYSSTGMESTLTRIRLCKLKPPVIALPLSNGLLRVADGLFIVKDVSRMHVGGQIDRLKRRVSFVVEGHVMQGVYRWRYCLLRSTDDHALGFANAFNVI